MQRRPLFFLIVIFSTAILITTRSVRAQSSASTFPRNLSIGDTGTDVSSLQSFLIAQELLPIEQPTGYFGTITKTAVSEWQITVNLPSTGYFGPQSRTIANANIASSIEINTTPAAAIDKPTSTIVSLSASSIVPTTNATSSTTYTQNLTLGSSGNDVSALQSFLITQGFLPIQNPTGYFGNLTAQALAKWQASQTIEATGYFGPITRTAINNKLALAHTIQIGNGVANPAAPIVLPTSTATSPSPSPVATANTYFASPILPSFSSGGGGGGDGNQIAPIVAIVSTADTTPPSVPWGLAATAVSATEIDVTWNASLDSVSTAGYNVFRNGIQIAATNSTSYHDTSLNAQTTYDYRISAYDASGNTSGQSLDASATTLTQTAPLSSDITAPIITITIPGNYATVSSTIPVSATASDNVGIADVQFKIDYGNAFAAITTAPYKMMWDTTSVATGTHTIFATATDVAGNKATAAIDVKVVRSAAPATTTITIPLPDTMPPTVPTGIFTTGITTSTISLSWNASTDPTILQQIPSGVSGYAIYRNGIKIGITPTTAFTDKNLTANTSYTYTIASYDIAGNASASSTPIQVMTNATTAQSSAGTDFGIAFGNTLIGLSTQTLDAQLDDLASLGVGWIRLDVGWNDIQPSDSSTFNWSNIDRVVNAANARHIKILANLGYTPTWAAIAGCQSTSKCAPANPAQFAAFAKAAATRYASQGVSDWEIWNEPNNMFFWQPKPNAADYTVLLKDTYTAIKNIEPNAVVTSGGLAPEITTNGNISPIDFLTQIYANGGRSYFDAVGFHPYSSPILPSNFEPWNAWSQMASTTPNLRNVMATNNDSAKKIWLTEVGAPTGGPGNVETNGNATVLTGNPDHVTETLQAQILSQSITDEQADVWTGPLFWYSYKDLGTSTSTVENFFGIRRFDGSEKPSYTTLQNALSG